MNIELDIEKPFKDLLAAANMKDMRKAMNTALRKAGKKVLARTKDNVHASGLGRGVLEDVTDDLRLKVYGDAYPAGFMIPTRPHHGKGFHLNRFGKEKPVLMWAAMGTKSRNFAFKGGKVRPGVKSHPTGRMKDYGFVEKTESEMAGPVSDNLYDDFNKALERRLKKAGLI